MMRRQMKLAAVLVVVVLALTGFSTSSSGGKGRSGKSSSSDGGGCSSSKKSNNGYRDTDYDDDDYGDSSSSSGSSGASPTPTPTASDEALDIRVIRCAAPRKGKRKAVTSSLIEVQANDRYTQDYEIDVRFVDARGNTVDTAEATTTLDSGDFTTLTVRMDSPGKVSRVDRCEVTAKVV
ncbi:hypothetical protein AMK14_06260 [Streptomyces sp. TSRI0445]|uniref:Secreted protein n=1 Tax=Streptomyces globisporus TaxID=1908 RepID=A0ABM9GQU0_STRGL|nr:MULTISPECIES: hypothetical protein [Streptomyces]PPA40629.1 hypothetical protein BF14_013175 [Streptomyces griseus]RAN17978.1 hypothetical protein A3838_12925 [Streptomyces badius]AWL86787.1 hypothetical protein DIJ69_13160 [Streptomyces globisporus]OKI72870.1 hypothetical protein AMK14_06260 [Streptomyces sp. TSRI0445]RAN25857.1 hypothetical protein A3800_12935 [Streptomyces badius]